MIDYQAEDAQVCAEVHCGNCGHPGLEYYGFRDQDGHYIRTCRCPKCETVEEF